MSIVGADGFTKEERGSEFKKRVKPALELLQKEFGVDNVKSKTFDMNGQLMIRVMWDRKSYVDPETAEHRYWNHIKVGSA